MMVGDGFNDAAAMAAADVGVAVGSGESTNLDAADILITGENRSVLSDLVKLSRKTRFVLLQNLAFSVLVTAVLVWSVLSGYNDNIVIGVLVHELSVIVVIFNGARLAGDLGLWNLLTDLFRICMSIRLHRSNSYFKTYSWPKSHQHLEAISLQRKEEGECGYMPTSVSTALMHPASCIVFGTFRC